MGCFRHFKRRKSLQSSVPFSSETNPLTIDSKWYFHYTASPALQNKTMTSSRIQQREKREKIFGKRNTNGLANFIYSWT